MVDSSNEESSPSLEQILTAVHQTGFIFEYQVAEKFRRHSNLIDLNIAYIDSDTQKTREIDMIVHVHNNIKNPETETILLEARIVAECKNYSTPIVVIGRENQFRYRPDQPFISFDPLNFEYASTGPEDIMGIISRLDMGLFTGATVRGFLGTQFVKMNRKGGKWIADNEAIYDSIIYPLTKAVKSEMDLEIEVRKNDPESLPWELPEIVYLFPVLVTANKIFTIDMTHPDKPLVKEAQWVPVVRHFSDTIFILDVVSFSYIDNYLEEYIKPALHEAKERLEASTNYFNPEWLISEYGESSDPVFLEWLAEFRSSHPH